MGLFKSKSKEEKLQENIELCKQLNMEHKENFLVPCLVGIGLRLDK